MHFLLSISGSWKAISLEKIRRLLLCTESVERLESRSSQCLFGGFRVFSTWDYAFLICQSEFSTLHPVPKVVDRQALGTRLVPFNNSTYCGSVKIAPNQVSDLHNGLVKGNLHKGAKSKVMLKFHF